jgi:quercetin 2,3-dioxygenase
MKIRKAENRGITENQWLVSQHSFPFGDYENPDIPPFGPLLVINEDCVEAGHGFRTHPHRNMEILTLVLSGELAHRDSLGNGSVLQAGDLQYMSAGTGVTHSEMNPSATDACRFLQIWIRPDRVDYAPLYGQARVGGISPGNWELLASPEEAVAPIRLRQEVEIWTFLAEPAMTMEWLCRSGRRSYVHLVSGSAENECGEIESAGDAVLMDSGEKILRQSLEPARWLVFDLPSD